MYIYDLNIDKDVIIRKLAEITTPNKNVIQDFDYSEDNDELIVQQCIEPKKDNFKTMIYCRKVPDLLTSNQIKQITYSSENQLKFENSSKDVLTTNHNQTMKLLTREEYNYQSRLIQHESYWVYTVNTSEDYANNQVDTEKEEHSKKTVFNCSVALREQDDTDFETESNNKSKVNSHRDMIITNIVSLLNLYYQQNKNDFGSDDFTKAFLSAHLYRVEANITPHNRSSRTLSGLNIFAFFEFVQGDNTGKKFLVTLNIESNNLIKYLTKLTRNNEATNLDDLINDVDSEIFPDYTIQYYSNNILLMKNIWSDIDSNRIISFQGLAYDCTFLESMYISSQYAPGDKDSGLSGLFNKDIKNQKRAILCYPDLSLGQVRRLDLTNYPFTLLPTKRTEFENIQLLTKTDNKVQSMLLMVSIHDNGGPTSHSDLYRLDFKVDD